MLRGLHTCHHSHHTVNGVLRSNWTSSQKKSVEGCSKQRPTAVQLFLTQKLPQARSALGKCCCCLPCFTTAPSLSIFAHCLTQCRYSCLHSLFCLFEGCQLVRICPILGNLVQAIPGDQLLGQTPFCFDMPVFTCLLPDPSPVHVASLLLPTPLCISVGF